MSRPEFHPPVALFLAVLGLVPAYRNDAPKPQVQIDDGAIVEFGYQVEIPLVHGHNASKSGCEVENVCRIGNWLEARDLSANLVI